MYEDRIKELENNLNFTYGNQILDYREGYICDVFSYIADSNIDIYVSDLFEWGKNNFEYINEATQEFGNPNDIIKQIQQGQYLCFEQELYNNQDDILKLYAFNYLEESKIKLNENQIDDLETYIEGLDNNDKLEDITSYCDEILMEDEYEI
jgi:hypothetical protein